MCYNISMVFDIFDIVYDGIARETLGTWNGGVQDLLEFCHGNETRRQILFPLFSRDENSTVPLAIASVSALSS